MSQRSYGESVSIQNEPPKQSSTTDISTPQHTPAAARTPGPRMARDLDRSSGGRSIRRKVSESVYYERRKESISDVSSEIDMLDDEAKSALEGSTYSDNQVESDNKDDDDESYGDDPTNQLLSESISSIAPTSSAQKDQVAQRSARFNTFPRRSTRLQQDRTGEQLIGEANRAQDTRQTRQLPQRKAKLVNSYVLEESTPEATSLQEQSQPEDQELQTLERLPSSRPPLRPLAPRPITPPPAEPGPSLEELQAEAKRKEEDEKQRKARQAAKKREFRRRQKEKAAALKANNPKNNDRDVNNGSRSLELSASASASDHRQTTTLSQAAHNNRQNISTQLRVLSAYLISSSSSSANSSQGSASLPSSPGASSTPPDTNGEMELGKRSTASELRQLVGQLRKLWEEETTRREKAGTETTDYNDVETDILLSRVNVVDRCMEQSQSLFEPENLAESLVQQGQNYIKNFLSNRVFLTANYFTEEERISKRDHFVGKKTERLRDVYCVVLDYMIKTTCKMADHFIKMVLNTTSTQDVRERRLLAKATLDMFEILKRLMSSDLYRDRHFRSALEHFKLIIEPPTEDAKSKAKFHDVFTRLCKAILEANEAQRDSDFQVQFRFHMAQKALKNKYYMEQEQVARDLRKARNGSIPMTQSNEQRELKLAEDRRKQQHEEGQRKVDLERQKLGASEANQQVKAPNGRRHTDFGIRVISEERQTKHQDLRRRHSQIPLQDLRGDTEDSTQRQSETSALPARREKGASKVSLGKRKRTEVESEPKIPNEDEHMLDANGGGFDDDWNHENESMDQDHIENESGQHDSRAYEVGLVHEPARSAVALRSGQADYRSPSIEHYKGTTRLSLPELGKRGENRAEQHQPWTAMERQALFQALEDYAGEFYHLSSWRIQFVIIDKDSPGFTTDNENRSTKSALGLDQLSSCE
jgi:hypothetical protein